MSVVYNKMKMLGFNKFFYDRRLQESLIATIQHSHTFIYDAYGRLKYYNGA